MPGAWEIRASHTVAGVQQLLRPSNRNGAVARGDALPEDLSQPLCGAMPIRVANKAARGVGVLGDRVLHPWRRRRALKSLRTLSPIESIIFLCKGNICRSPFAAELFVQLLPEHLRPLYRVSSAGLWGHLRSPPGEAVRVGFVHGIDLSDHRSRRLSRADLEGVDLVVVMSSEQRRKVMQKFGCPADSVLVLGDLDPEPIESRTIIDPWSHSEAVFEASFARINRAVRVLVRELTARHVGFEGEETADRDGSVLEDGLEVGYGAG